MLSLALNKGPILLTIAGAPVNICSAFEQMNTHKTDILHHEKILSVIKELEQNPAITQRDLARKLKISLSKINRGR